MLTVKSDIMDSGNCAYNRLPIARFSHFLYPILALSPTSWDKGSFSFAPQKAGQLLK
jgi:hypothetical protein